MYCKKCFESIKTDEFIKCSLCQYTYHHSCGGLTDAEFKKILPMNKAKWKCVSCKNSSKNSNVKISPPAGKSDNTSPTHGETMVNFDLNSLLSHIDMKFNSLSSAIDSFKSDVSDKLNNLTATIKTWDNKINTMESSISSLSDEIIRVNGVNKSLKIELDELKKSVNDISDKFLKNEQWVRRSNIQINGMPQKENENLIEVIKNLADKSGFRLNPETDIDFVTRVAIKNDKENKTPKPIIVKMHSRYKKDDFITSLRKLKNLNACDFGFTSMRTRIYVNDHLSPRNKMLLRQAKQKAKEKGYAYCWVRNCTVMVRKSETTPVIHITSEECLKKIV